MDVPGTPATFQGTMHLVVAGLVAPLTVAIPLVFGLGFNKLTAFKNFSVLSFVFSGVILITGLTSALSINFLPAFMGLFERLTIFGYLLYVFLLASKTLKSYPSEF